MKIQVVEYRLWLEARGLRSRVVGALGHDDLVAFAPEAQRAHGKSVDSGEYAAVVIAQRDRKIAVDMQRRTRAETCVSKLPCSLDAFVRSDGGELGRIEARRAQAQRLASAPLGDESLTAGHRPVADRISRRQTSASTRCGWLRNPCGLAVAP